MNATLPSHRPRRELIAFCLWTVGISFLVWGPLALLQIPVAQASGTATPGPGLALYLLGGFIPSIVGIAMQGWTEGRAGVARLFRRAIQLRFNLRWYGAMLLICLSVAGMRLLVQWLASGEIRVSEPLAGLLANPVLWIGVSIQILFLGPLSEEFGWRAYAQDRVLACFSPLKGSLLLGAVWAVWHLPLFFIPGTSQSTGGAPVLAFLFFAIGVLGLTLSMTWLYNRTGRSLGAAILTHTLANYSATLVTFLIVPSLLDTAVQGLSHLAVGLLILLLVGRQLGARADAAKSNAAA